jgi:pimeloyl-ACP methyl ester carboxylesterase
MKVFSQLLSLAFGLFTASMVSADITQDLSNADNPDLNGSNFTYPYPVEVHRFDSQGLELEMAYMDIRPPHHNGQNIMLMHGKNFCGATWNATIVVLAAAGYRVIVPDQIGFCKSSKPTAYQFSLQQLALNTQTLLQHLGIQNLTVMGHSMGGMLGTRFALMFPQNTTRLVLVDPIGLEDWKAVGVPYQSIDITYIEEHASNYTSIRAYEQFTYYVGNWSTAYDVWVNMLVNIYKGPLGVQYAWDQALVTDMVLTQPIVYEFPLLQPPTLLFVGDKDTTAIGKAWSPPAVQAKLGHYNILGPKVCSQIPNCTLIQYPDLGHAPQIEEPDLFHSDLLGWLGPGYTS